MNHLLGEDDLNRLSVHLTNFDSEGVAFYVQSIEAMISAFDNQEIVQSLYASGKFGAGTKEKLESFLKILNDFRETYRGEGGLIDLTRNYINQVREENNRTR